MAENDMRGMETMAAYSWNASGGGDWGTAADWTPANIPTILDSVDFATGGNTYTVTGDGSTASLTVDGDSVTFEGSITAGTFGSATGLSIIDSGSVVVDQTASFLVSSLAAGTGSLLSVYGLLVDTGGGNADDLTVNGPDGDLVIGSALTVDGLLSVTNGGTVAGNVVLADGGGLALDTTANVGGNTLTTQGTTTLQVGNMGQAGSVPYTLSDTIDLGAGTLSISLDQVALSVAGPISGSGGLAITTGEVSLAGGNTYAGGTSVDSASLVLSGADAAGTGPVLLSNALLTVQADSTGGAGSLTVIGTGGADTVLAQAGSLLVFADNAGSLTFQGGTQASTVVGGSGVLTAVGGTAGDELFGGTSGNDHLTAGTAATTLVGAGGTFTALGTAGDLLVAAGGNTTLNGGDSHGNDIFFANSGNTVIETGTGTSTIVVNGGSASIYGGVGTENVFLSGGMSQLDYVDGFNGGTVNVVGFGASDSLHVFDYPGDEVQAALNSAVVNSGNTIVTLTDNTHIVLFGFTGLSASNFG